MLDNCVGPMSTYNAAVRLAVKKTFIYSEYQIKIYFYVAQLSVVSGLVRDAENTAQATFLFCGATRCRCRSSVLM